MSKLGTGRAPAHVPRGVIVEGCGICKWCRHTLEDHLSDGCNAVKHKMGKPWRKCGCAQYESRPRTFTCPSCGNRYHYAPAANFGTVWSSKASGPRSFRVVCGALTCAGRSAWKEN